MVALEAMAAGKLVIAAAYGGVTEVVIDQKTGILLNHKTLYRLQMFYLNLF